VRAAVARLLACALLVASSLAAPAAGAPDAHEPLHVRGQLLAVASGYVVFTTGDAVALAPAVKVPAAALGDAIVVTLDPRTHAATAVELAPAEAIRGEIDASSLPREYVAVDARSARSASDSARAGAGASGQVAIAIEVRVPDDTPPSDDVYLATDRTGFNASELRLNRVDAHRWTVSLLLPAGATLHYLFTRGTYATVERARGGAIEQPHTVTALTRATVDDVVERWADST
jgi:hypothetical protein